jgi:hypothetical protein
MSTILRESARRFEAWRASRNVDLSSTLFVDVNSTRAELKNLTDTRRPEFQSGKKAFGAAHNLRVLGVIALIWALIVLVGFALIIEYGWPPGYTHTPAPW